MKRFKYFLLFVGLLATAVISCTDDEYIQDTTAAIQAPTELDLAFAITQDNSGMVTITPSAVGATMFEIFYGDGTPDSDAIDAGESTERMYPEGQYQVRMVATGLTGKTAEVTKDLMVSFQAPQNLEITIAPDPSNSFGIIVSATADLATSFEVTFGEDPAQVAVPLQVGGTVSYAYAAIGDYTVTVTALSGGA